MSGRMSHFAVLTACVVALTACGTQVDTATRRQLKQEALGRTTTSQGAGSPLTDGGSTGGSAPTTTTTGGAPVAGGTTGAVPPAGTTGGTVPGGTTGSTGTTGQAAPPPTGGNGGATDVGVTGTSITLGNVADLSGPQPGLFQTAINGTNAYIAYVNSQGGLYGRQLKISVADSQTSCEGDRTGHEGLINKVFAFAGSFSLYDSCGASVLKQHPGIPDAHLAVTPEANALSNNFSVNPVGNKLNNGLYSWALNKFGRDVVEHTAFMYVNLPAVTNVAALQRRSAESVGWKFVYTRAVGATDTDFTADIIQMKRKGVKMFLTLFNADEMSNLKPQADQQSFKPTYIAPLMYDQTFFKKLGGSAAAEGIYGSNGSTLFFSPEDAKVIPSVALFQQWYARVSGGAAADTFAADAWAETALLVQAMRTAGPKLTRASVLKALQGITLFDADGFFAPANPAAKKPGNCYLVWVIKSGRYLRLDTPAKGFRCDGRPA
jgi:ABC-type branched-subunit amino acid transport system substrate-binding protein